MGLDEGMHSVDAFLVLHVTFPTSSQLYTKFIRYHSDIKSRKGKEDREMDMYKKTHIQCLNSDKKPFHDNIIF